VVGECASFKSLIPNCANFGFVQDFWTEIKSDVLRFLLEFHRNDKLTKGMNCTLIVLILKAENLPRLNEFRLISLVGCLYKILAKVIVNLLRCVTRSVITDAHSDFIKGGHFMDDMLIVNEVVDESIKLKKISFCLRLTSKRRMIMLIGHV